MNAASFFVEGVPQPAGNKTAIAIRHKAGARAGQIVMKNGRPVINMVEGRRPKSRKAAQDWRKSVSCAARMAWDGPPIPAGQPVRIALYFSLPRPKSHYNTKGIVKSSAPDYPCGHRRDWDKFSRSVGDSLTGIVYEDDGQVVEAFVTKRYAAINPGVTVVVGRLGDGDVARGLFDT